MSEFEDVAGVSDVAEGHLLGVKLSDGEHVCVYNYKGTIGAVSDLCTHSEFYMSDGVLHRDGSLECMWHGARFDCRTGAPRRFPAIKPLPVYEVEIADGRIRVAPRTSVEPTSPEQP
ncbi:MAG: Rieske 2Fe-2S domain-containing protein [Gemmatimonadota bacterium]